MKNEILLPRSFVDFENVCGMEELLKEKQLQIGLVENALTTVEDGGHMILDFGRELAGGVRLLIYQCDQGASLRLRLGESAAECCAELGEKNCGNAHAYRDLTVPAIALSDSSFFDSGFRFLRIDVTGGKVSFKSVVAEAHESEVVRTGSFECSDPLLNRIAETAARTVELCVRRGVLWDGIKRDRLVWIGDIYPEVLALETLTSDLSSVTRSLDFVKSQTPPWKWMNNIPDYSMWWMIILCEYYRRTGDKDYLTAQTDYIEELLKNVDKYILEDGSDSFGFNLVDWPTHETADEPAGVHMLTVMGMNAAEEILNATGRDTALCREIKARLQRKQVTVREKKQIVALKDFTYGSLSEAEKEILTTGGASGMSTFMSYFLLRAMDRASGTEFALTVAKDYYGAMLNLGATSFWEDFNTEWTEGAICPIDRLPAEGEKDIHGDFGAYCYLGYRHSLCHGWSSGVLPYLVEKVLGVTVCDGGNTVVIEPSLGGLEWAKGCVPLKKGLLSVEIRDGKTKLKAPAGVKVVCKSRK